MGRASCQKSMFYHAYQIHSDLKAHARLVIKPVPILGYSIHCPLVLRLQGTLKGYSYPPKTKVIINLL